MSQLEFSFFIGIFIPTILIALACKADAFLAISANPKCRILGVFDKALCFQAVLGCVSSLDVVLS
jgi:hypothetical protein